MWTQGEVLFEVTEGGHWQDRERAESVKLCPTLPSSGHSVILQVTFLVVTTISPRVEVKSVSTKEYKRISKNMISLTFCPLSCYTLNQWVIVILTNIPFLILTLGFKKNKNHTHTHWEKKKRNSQAKNNQTQSARKEQIKYSLCLC